MEKKKKRPWTKNNSTGPHHLHQRHIFFSSIFVRKQTGIFIRKTSGKHLCVLLLADSGMTDQAGIKPLCMTSGDCPMQRSLFWRSFLARSVAEAGLHLHTWIRWRQWRKFSCENSPEKVNGQGSVRHFSWWVLAQFLLSRSWRQCRHDEAIDQTIYQWHTNVYMWHRNNR